ncbi:hypothetical protein MUK42_29057 [Musa troglodytarum]|uniref:Uncharacterized protein n=1 Tax=Musa troglodytarum TaxID=320322 RepID=A0A9E7F235_9LILI|nr:hypothetical protein MUK42_29057 [Musa troglodytarum]
MMHNDACYGKGEHATYESCRLSYLLWHVIVMKISRVYILAPILDGPWQAPDISDFILAGNKHQLLID